jgi:glycosyltransferase involved in cell wall biosynthesis
LPPENELKPCPIVRIAINTRFFLKDKMEGIGWYSYEVVKRMVLAHPEDEFIFLFDRKAHPDFQFADNVQALELFPPARHPLLFKLWFDVSIPAALSRHPVDVFFSPDGFCSLRYSGKTVLVVHDLAYRSFPEHLKQADLWYYRHYMPKFIRKADQIIAISEEVAGQIRQFHPEVDSKRIHVVHNGVREDFHPVDPVSQSAIRRRFTGGDDFFLFVGAIHPRKNVGRILEAFEKYRSTSGETKKLVLCGRFAWKSQEIQEQIRTSPYREDVIMLERVSNEDLIGLMGSARALVYPSLLEGFGLPILEGFRSEIPVITSNISSMPEVAGDAALLADPYSADSICTAMLRLDDAVVRGGYIDKGRERVQQFSWQATAEKVYEIIKSCAGK